VAAYGASTREYLAADQGLWSGANQLAFYRALYAGDRAVTVEHLKSIAIASGVDRASGLDASYRDFPVLNELRAIIDRRIDIMPKAFDFVPDETRNGDEQLARRLNAWADIDLREIMPEFYRDQELDGNAAPVLSREAPGEPIRCTLRDTQQLGLSIDPRTRRYLAARFVWSDRMPDGAELLYRQTFDDRSESFMAGEREAQPQRLHGFASVPVVIVPRIREHGRVLGVSGVPEHVEAYMHFLWSHYLLAVANKYEAFGIYCPAKGEDSGALLPDQDTGRQATFEIRPACLYPIPVEKVGGNINVGSIVSQLEDARAVLYRIGKVRAAREQIDARSGKAIMMDTAELRDYAAKKLLQTRRGLMRIAELVAWAEGWVPVGQSVGVSINFEDDTGSDAAEQSKRAETWFKLWAAKGCTTEQLLFQWQRLGMLDEDDDPKAMAEAAEAAAGEGGGMEDVMAAAADAARQAKAGPAPVGAEAMQEVEDEDETPEAEPMMGGETDG
jgi:hypothetical protein